MKNQTPHRRNKKQLKPLESTGAELAGDKKRPKARSKRHQPRGLTILFEDDHLLVVDKASGLLTMSNAKERDRTAYFALNNYVRKGNPKSRKRIFIVHRLDRDTSGVLVFAKSEKHKRFLQDKWSGFSKKYYAVIHGTLAEKEGVLSSYLAENAVHKMYAVEDPKKGKLAKTGYKVIRESRFFSLVEIDLLTGRKNQIRVHFADIGCPVAGDKVYGDQEKGYKRLTLHAGTMTFLHPQTRQQMTIEAALPHYFNTLLNK